MSSSSSSPRITPPTILTTITTTTTTTTPTDNHATELDPFLPFLAHDFNPATFVQPAIIAGGDELDHALQSILSQRDTVDKTISALVAMHSDALLATLQVVGTLKREALSVNSDVAALDVSLSRVVRDFREPYERLQAAVNRLNNIQQAANLLRKVGWFMAARKKFLLQLAIKDPDTREVSKTAQLIGELESLLADGELRGVTVVDSSRVMLVDAGKTVRKDAQAALERATFTLNQGEIGYALQAFFNLSELSERVSSLTVWAAKEFGSEAREALSSASILEESNKRALESKETISSLQRYVLRARADALLERSLRSWALRAWNLQRVLYKKRDPITHVLFSDVVKKDVFDEFWSRAAQTLEGEIKSVSATKWVREALVEDYARLRRTARAMLSRLRTSTAVSSSSSTTASGSGSGGVGGPTDAAVLLQALHPLLGEFLRLTLTRLTDPVHTMFGSSSSKTGAGFPILPTPNDIVTFAGVIQKELAAILNSDMELASTVYKSACVAVALFCEKAEGVVSTADDARRFRLAPPDLGFVASNASSTPSNVTRTNAQEHNLALLLLIFSLSNKLKGICTEFDMARARGGEAVDQQGDDGGGNNSGGGGGDATRLDDDDGGEDQHAHNSDDGGGEGEQDMDNGKQLPTNHNNTTTTLPTVLLPTLQTAIKQLDDLTHIIVDQDIGSDNCYLALDMVLADFHKEDFNRESITDSMFMKRFTRALKTLSVEHISKFPTTEPVVREAMIRLARRIVDSFCRRVSLARPVGRAGIGCLKRDVHMVHEELCQMFEPLGAWSSVLDAELDGLEELVNAGLAEMIQLIRGGHVKKGVVLHYIFATAPGMVVGPMANRSVGKYLLEWANAKDQDEFAVKNVEAVLGGYSGGSSRDKDANNNKAVEKVLVMFDHLKGLGG